MSKLFGYIFWGLLLVFLDLKINGVDVLPDFIGYALVGSGASGLVQVSQRFGLAGALGWFLAVASVVSLVIDGEAAAILGWLIFIVDCAMLWMLLGGVRDYSSEKSRADLAEQAHGLRIAWIALTAPIWLLSLTLRGGSGPAFVLIAIVGIGTLVVMFLILRLIYRVRHDLTAKDDSLGDDAPQQ